MIHGTRSCYVQHKCRCDACTQANRDYARNRERHHARVRYGIEDPHPDRYIDATEVREHLAWLRTKGIGLRTVADRTGLGRTALQQLATGESRMVQPRNADKILAVSAAVVPGATLIDATRTWQLINDLLYLGFTKTSIAKALGNGPALQIARTKVRRTTADAIEQIHERWSQINGWHGTHTGYTTHRCRCLACRAYQTERQRERRSTKEEAA